MPEVEAEVDGEAVVLEGDAVVLEAIFLLW